VFGVAHERRARYTALMATLKATVENGVLVLNEPTCLPDGTVVELQPSEGWDGLDADERRLLHEALAASENDVNANRVRPVDALLAELRVASK